jgi:hypothetical protein
MPDAPPDPRKQLDAVEELLLEALYAIEQCRFPALDWRARVHEYLEKHHGK